MSDQKSDPPPTAPLLKVDLPIEEETPRHDILEVPSEPQPSGPETQAELFLMNCGPTQVGIFQPPIPEFFGSPRPSLLRSAIGYPGAHGQPVILFKMGSPLVVQSTYFSLVKWGPCAAEMLSCPRCGVTMFIDTRPVDGTISWEMATMFTMMGSYYLSWRDTTASVADPHCPHCKLFLGINQYTQSENEVCDQIANMNVS